MRDETKTGAGREKSLLGRLFEYGEGESYPFHMPGHKRRLLPRELETARGLDITEIDGFDDLHNPKGIINECQKRAAALYGSDVTAFLVNGSSGGILAAISACCRPGAKIVVARNCHRSVYSAIEINCLNPIYIYPQVDELTGICLGITPGSIEKVFDENGEISCLVITSPTYEGMCSNIGEICRIAHDRGIPVIVDEAHGAHFRFSDVFPQSSIECGGDIVINSLHKTMPALTQTALMHINGDLVDRKRLRHMLKIFQTSSPSYILMGSIDGCIRMMEDDGVEIFEKYTANLLKLREELSNLKMLKLLKKNDFQHIWDMDASKLVISSLGSGITGLELMQRLRENFSLEMEMAGPDYIIAMTAPGDDAEGFKRLNHAVHEIDNELSAVASPGNATAGCGFLMPHVDKAMNPAQALWKNSESIRVSGAVGRIAAEYIYIYPPGIPLIVPGEIINEDVCSIIKSWMEIGFDVRGIGASKTGEATVEVLA